MTPAFRRNERARGYRRCRMIEVMVETWSSPKSGTTYRWSLWRDGTRVAMGGPHASLDDSEDDARAFCTDRYQQSPDRVTRL